MSQSTKQSRLDVSVVIVNYNVRDFLSQSIVSIQKALKGISSEIFVVDNASDDGSAEMLRRRFSRVKLIVNDRNLGFAKANNIAIDQAKGRFLLLINPDTVVQEDTVKVMLEFFKSHPDAGMAGCKIINPDGSFEPACRRSFPFPWVAFTKITGLGKLFPRTEIFGKYNMTYLSTEETYPVDAISGSFMMARKEAIKSVGGLDEEFFMYGEDIDWCYRIRKAGWQIYYVHSTQIIHYKGESTRRSDLDEISTFYEAMHLFVKKHFRSSTIFAFLLRLSIGFVSFGAFVKSVLNPLKVAILDFILVDIAILLSEKIWRGLMLVYPDYAYSVVFTVPALIVIGSLYVAGVYTNRRMSISHSLVATFIAYILISALTAFFKEYALSRMMVVISGAISAILIPGWRFIIRMLSKTKVYGRGTLIGKRTLIVGTNREAMNLHKKLRARISEGYDVVGFVGTTHKYIGKPLNGLKIVGSIDNIGKVIREQKINDVIFAPNALGYGQILSVIARCKEQAANFHLVPTTMEVIISKANVHSLDDMPLVQITYSINKPFYSFLKRVFDITISLMFLITIYPIYIFWCLLKGRKSGKFIRFLPQVLNGKFSMVGAYNNGDNILNGKDDSLILGKPGLCSLIQLQKNGNLSDEEKEQYSLYYARNQSVLLDLEILIKSWIQYREDKRFRK